MEEQMEWILAQNVALKNEVTRLSFIIESVRVTQPDMISILERSWEIKREETEND